MAAIWIHDDAAWGVLPMTTSQFAMRDEPGAAALREVADADLNPTDAVIVRCATGETLDGPWVLLAAPGWDVAVNGSPILGMKILADRDEVRLGRRRFYFSAERLVRPEPFRGPAGICCARCTAPIAIGSVAVRCGCNLWFHQDPTAELGCYVYADRCCGCEAPTWLDADFTWTPEGL